jgi:PAS domain-containing protein
VRFSPRPLAQQAGLRIGLWDWDIDANTVIWSEETYHQWGFTPETFSSRVEDAVTRIHQDDGARVELAIAMVLSGEAKEFAEQYRIVRPDGSTCWIDAQGVMLQDDGLHMMGVGVDITGLNDPAVARGERREVSASSELGRGGNLWTRSERPLHVL